MASALSAAGGGDGRLVGRDLVYEVEAARLLDHVHLHADTGEFVGLVGPNGAGKSTLLRTVSGLLKATSGTVLLDGEPVGGMGARARARAIAQLPQLAPYTHGFTALELVLMGRYPHMGRFSVEGARDRSIAREAMDTMEVSRFAGRDLDTLSGGERQRVFIARALAQQPKVLLLDEPTANLDIQHQVRVLQIVRELVGAGMAAVAAIHDLPLAARFCDRLVLLSRGRVVSEGPPDAVLTPANIEAAFGVESVVTRDPLTGSLNLTVVSPAQRGGPRGTVHVVCGGGTGARLLYRLYEAGYGVTAGPLGSGDTDRAAAEALGAEFVPVPAFGAIGDDAHARHVELVRAADIAVLCPVPVGEGNLRNLEALREARSLLIVAADSFHERDFSGGGGARVFASLRADVTCPDIEGVPGAVADVTNA